MKRLMTIVATAATFAASTVLAQAHSEQAPPPAAPAPAAPATPAATPYYSVEETTIGDLMENPATKAVLAKHVPALVEGDGITQAYGMTLLAIQSFAGDILSDEVLAAIQKDLNDIPAPAN